MINRSFKEFKKKHQKKINQVIYSSINIKNENFLINLVNNFLNVKNSFVFEHGFSTKNKTYNNN